MNFNLEARTDFLYIEPQGEMTIDHAATIKEQLHAVFTAQQDVEINLSKVTEIDSAGIQLLLLIKREVSSAGHELRLTAHSRAVIELYELYNLTAYFGDPVLIVDSSEDSGTSERTIS